MRWNRHGHYDSHIPEVFPLVTFSGKLWAANEMGHGRTRMNTE
ncbi:hypothetical protein SBA4_1400017 [Candidatus Sulfopaludibacter sp. SbA4]|nr:hypothetical protein SBA4_1400017 [Candidatus Sulfopaludibacter sp. SbA4]